MRAGGRASYKIGTSKSVVKPEAAEGRLRGAGRYKCSTQYMKSGRMLVCKLVAHGVSKRRGQKGGGLKRACGHENPIYNRG